MIFMMPYAILVAGMGSAVCSIVDDGGGDKAAPAAPTASSPTTSSIDIDWMEVEWATNYVLKVYQDVSNVANYTLSEHPQTIGSLSAGTEYQFRIEATDGETTKLSPFLTASTAADVPGVPVHITPPVVAGFEGGPIEVGFLLVCDPGTCTNSPTGFAFQWKSNGTDISGQASSAFTPGEEHRGTAISCGVVPSNGAGDGSQSLSNETDPLVAREHTQIQCAADTEASLNGGCLFISKGSTRLGIYISLANPELTDFQFALVNGPNLATGGEGKRLFLNIAGTDTQVWFNTGTEVEPAPLDGYSSVQCMVDSAADNLAVASAFHALLNGMGGGAALNGTVVSYRNAANGDVTDATPVDSGAEITVQEQGGPGASAPEGVEEYHALTTLAVNDDAEQVAAKLATFMASLGFAILSAVGDTFVARDATTGDRPDAEGGPFTATVLIHGS